MRQYEKLKNKINELVNKINELVIVSNNTTIKISEIIDKINRLVRISNHTNIIISEINEDIIDALNCYILDNRNEISAKDIETLTENDDICNPKYLFAIKDLREDKIIFSARGGAYKTFKNAKIGIDKLVSKSNGRKTKDDYKIIVWKRMD